MVLWKRAEEPKVTPRLFRLSAVALLCLLLQAAQAGPIPDPPGDASPGGGSFLDIASIDVAYTSTLLNVTLTFFSGPGIPLLPPSSGAPFSIVGVIEFDVDQNVMTGDPPLANSVRPGIGHPLISLGVDFAADLFSESAHASLIDILSGTIGGPSVGLVPILYGPISLSFSIPLALLGGDNGIVDYSAIIGDLTGPTDAAPLTTATSAEEIPEPASWLMAGSGLVVMGLRHRRKIGARR